MTQTVNTCITFDPSSYPRTQGLIYTDPNENFTLLLYTNFKQYSLCISLCLDRKSHITKAAIGITVKIICHALKGDNSYSENTLGCQDKIKNGCQLR